MSAKFFVRNSGAGNGCANFMGAWENAFFCRKTHHAHKIPRFWGGGYFGFLGGGGSADLSFTGIFLILRNCPSPLTPRTFASSAFCKIPLPELSEGTNLLVNSDCFLILLELFAPHSRQQKHSCFCSAIGDKIMTYRCFVLGNYLQ